jgi:hypothetical protein
MARRQAQSEHKRGARSGSVLIRILNVVLIAVVVCAMLLMLASELVIDRAGCVIFGYCFKSAQTGGDLLVQSGDRTVAVIPYLAQAADFANSFSGYLTLILPPCVLLVVLQLIRTRRREDDAPAQQGDDRPAQQAEDAARTPQEKRADAAFVRQQQAQSDADLTLLEMALDAETPASPDAAAASQREDAAAQLAMQQAQQQELLHQIAQLKQALYESEARNEALRARAVEAIRKARQERFERDAYADARRYADAPQNWQTPVYPPYIPYSHRGDDPAYVQDAPVWEESGQMPPHMYR